MLFSAATERDLAEILALLRDVKLPVDGVEEHLASFFVVREKHRLLGVAGLEIYGEVGLLRSLAVDPAHQGQGLGQALYDYVIAQARRLGVRELYLLTETAEAFFARRGFGRIAREDASPAVQASVEFRSACCPHAACMRLLLA